MPENDFIKNSAFDETETDRNHQNVFDTNVFAVDFSKGVKKFWYLVVILALLFGMLSGYFAYTRYVPMYESSVAFSVSAVAYNSNGSMSFASYYDNASASQLSKTFPYIVNTSLMRNAIANELESGYINGTISASAVASDSNIFKVSVSSDSPEDAYNIVNAIIKVYPDVAVFVVGNVSLKILIKPTLPDKAYNANNYIRTAIIMALVGTTAGFGLIAVYALFRNTIKKKEDFKNKLNQKCYVEIPHVVSYRKTNDKQNEDKIIRITDKNPLFKESFRLLRKRLLRNLDEDENIIAVTSAADGEGKTTVSLNLAHTLAIANKKTACVDFDFKSNKLMHYLHPENFTGFMETIAEDSSYNYADAAYELEKNLDIYFPGEKNYNVLDGSYEEFFEYLRETYDYVIVNLSQGNYIIDSVTVSNMCDGILLVAKQDSVSVDKIRKTLEYLSFSSAKILGFVFNSVQEGFSGYGGYYYGGKYGYGKYGYGKYGYGKYGYGKKYGYGRKGYGYGYGNGYGYGHGYGYGYGYGYGHEEDDEDSVVTEADIAACMIDDSDIPDNND